MNGFMWVEYLIFLGLSLVGAVCIVPYAMTLIPPEQRRTIKLSKPALTGVMVAQSLVVMGVASAIGMLAAPAVGLAAPVIAALARGQNPAETVRAMLLPALSLGLLCGAVLVIIEALYYQPRLPDALKNIDHEAGPVKAFLASFYGGISEEILARWFIMSGLAWILGRFWTGPEGLPAAGAIWTANLLAAILFGLGHLPATAGKTRLTPLIVGRAISLNGIAGLAFGYLFWQYGLEAAILAHFLLDLLIHIALPMFLTRGSQPAVAS